MKVDVAGIRCKIYPSFANIIKHFIGEWNLRKGGLEQIRLPKS